MFNYDIKYCKKEDNINADYLSRAPLNEAPDGVIAALEWEIAELQEETLHHITSTAVISAMITQETSTDPELSSTCVVKKFTISNGITLCGKRVVIPKKLQPAIMNELHMTRLGIVKMKQLARNYCYWSGIDADLQCLVKSCVQCSEYQKQPAKVKVHHWEIPENNFDQIHIDFSGPRKGYQFLIVVKLINSTADE
ncbi:uncharacterized protein K02A2.6-like [Planococcus citri]|uniref:uncharacterized protein K02A2.6-like n=1 Tax=Planococcus citri TaxID=170843 RepID=UPI0031F8BE3B